VGIVRLSARIQILSLACVALLTACGGPSGASGMAISGKVGALSAKDLEIELNMLANDKAFVDTVMKDQKVRDGKGFDKKFVATVLQQHLFDDIIAQEAKDRNVKPLPMSDAIKKQVLGNLGGSKEALDGFSAKYRDQLFLTQRLIEPLLSKVQDKYAKPYFDKHKDEFVSACVTHLLVETEDAAKAAKARIEKGETFAVVAKEVSKDTGSGEKGGELGCTTLSTYVPEFAVAAAKLPINELSDPVQSQFGFHILKVTKRDAPTWNEEAQKIARQKVDDEAVTDIRASIKKRVKGAGIVVNPKFGVLDTSEDIPVIKEKGFVIGASTTLALPSAPAP
jgi:foldase protein PrsA